MALFFSIPKPCSENWNQMDATSQGAYCAKCTKEVVDCTSIKSAEIKTTLETKENPCVRIFKTQIDEMNFLEWFGAFSLKKQLKYAFLFAYLIVFNSNGNAQDTPNKSQTINVDRNFIQPGLAAQDSLFAVSINDSIVELIVDDSLPNEALQAADAASCSELDKVSIQHEKLIIPEDAMIHYVPHVLGDYIVETVYTMGFTIINPEPLPIESRSLYLADELNKPQIITDSPNLSLDNSRYSFNIEDDSLRFMSYALDPETIRIKITKKGASRPFYFNSIKIERGAAEILFPLNDFENGIYILTVEGEKSSKAIELVYW